ncbi:MAG: carboxypeptidase regulatory-like domain-containing protein, partial [Planctomycetota bacterium]|nr:carboxypeptidase regulatory-like domain-containing protein [Planctomycetota bacterium]
NFPASVSERDGLSVWEVLDWNLLRSGAEQLTRLPLREDLDKALIAAGSVVADENGHYQFGNLEPGQYLVAAAAQDTLLTPFPEIIEFDGTPLQRDILCLLGSSLTVRVRAGNSGAKGARVILRGSVIDSSVGSESWFMTREELILYMLNPPIREARADDAGIAHFGRLPRINYQLFVQKSPWAQASQTFVLQDPREIVIELQPGATIDGIVVSTEGVGVEAARVRVSKANGNDWGQIPAPLPETISGADGRFLLEGIPPGSYEIRTEAKGFVDGRLRNIQIEFDEILPAEVVVEAGAIIRGIVRNDAGKPLKDIDVSAERSGRNRQGQGETTVTDGDGKFIFDTLTAGDYRVACTGDSWRRWRETVKTGGEELEVTMTVAPALIGRVLDSRGEALFRAQVQIDQGWGGGDATVTDKQGRFRLSLEIGGDRIVVRARGFAELRQQSDPEGGDLGDLILADAELITGLALAPDGAPLSGARVTANEQRQDGDNNNRRGQPRRMNATAWSSSDGSYRLELPQPGLRWQVKASFPLLLESEEVVVQPIDGLAAEVNLMLRWGAEVGGIVIGDGSPVEGATVTLSRSGNRNSRRQNGGWNRNSRSARTDQNGHFLIRGLEQATYNLRASATGFGDARIQDLALTADEQRHLEVVLQREARLEGVVIDQFGAPIAAAQVSASDSSGAWRRGSSGPDGFFAIDRLVPGEINVRADASGYMRYRLNDVNPSLGPIEIVMDQSFEFRGFVVDAETGDPISRARVRITLSNSRSRGDSDRTGEEGYFRIQDLRTGEYDISATAEGYISARFSAPIPGRNPDETVVIELEPGARIIVDVVDLSGVSVEGASLRAYRLEEGAEADGNSSQRTGRSRADDSATTNQNGRGTLVGLTDGFYRVSIDHSEYIPAESVAVVKRIEGSARVRVVLERGATIRGDVRSLSGDLLSNGRVYARGPVTKRSNVDDSGQYLIQGLPAGSYEVNFDPFAQGPEPDPRGQITVSGTEERVLDLRP